MCRQDSFQLFFKAPSCHWHVNYSAKCSWKQYRKKIIGNNGRFSLKLAYLSLNPQKTGFSKTEAVAYQYVLYRSSWHSAVSFQRYTNSTIIVLARRYQSTKNTFEYYGGSWACTVSVNSEVKCPVFDVGVHPALSMHDVGIAWAKATAIKHGYSSVVKHFFI